MSDRFGSRPGSFSHRRGGSFGHSSGHGRTHSTYGGRPPSARSRPSFHSKKVGMSVAEKLAYHAAAGATIYVAKKGLKHAGPVIAAVREHVRKHPSAAGAAVEAIDAAMSTQPSPAGDVVVHHLASGQASGRKPRRPGATPGMIHPHHHMMRDNLGRFHHGQRGWQGTGYSKKAWIQATQEVGTRPGERRVSQVQERISRSKKRGPS